MYTGEQIKVNAGEYDTYTVDSGNSGVEAGPYKMVVSPKSNYKWSDLEGQSALGSREITWVIDRRPIAPSGERNLEYDNGTNLYPEITATYNGVSVSFTPSWENTSEINAEGSYYTGKLKLDNTNFRWTQSNQSYIVNGSVVVTDSVSEDGNTITIWYRITQEQYELEIKIQDGPFDYTSGTPTFTYNGSFPSVSVGKGVAITSTLPSEVQNSKTALYIVDSSGNIMDNNDSADVGTYYVYLVIDETEHYAQGESNHAMFKIVKGDIKIDSGLNDYYAYYTGKSLSSVPTEPILSIVEGNNPIITYSKTKDGTYSSIPPSFTDVLIIDKKVSGYPVYYKIEADNYNTCYGSFVFTVKPAEITVTVEPWAGIEYSNSAPKLDASNHWDITNGLDNGDDLGLSFTTEGILPGTHDVICKSSNNNYDVTFVGIKTCTIDPATILTSGNFVGYHGQYDGSNHSVVVTIPTIQTVSSNYTIHYSWNHSTNCDDYKESSLSIRDVPTSEDHTLTVYYAIKEDYHNSVLGSFNVTVNPKPLTLTVNNASVQYGYDPAFSVTHRGFVESDNPAELLENIQYTHSYEAGKANSGDKFSVDIIEDSLELDNYEIAKYSGTLTVIDRVICISMDSNSYEYTYDEQPESIPQKYSLVRGEFYSDDKDVFAIVAKDTNGNTMSPKLDVGQYYLVPDVSNDNYTIEMQSQVNYIITATTLTINFSAYDKTYDGTAKVITATAADHGDVTVKVTYYEVVDGNEIELLGAPTDAGNYKVKANVVSTKNYTAGSASLEMVIDQATITVSSYSGVSAGMTFSGSGSQYTDESMVPVFGGQVILSGVKSFDIGDYVEGVGFVLNAVDVLDASFSYYAEDGTTAVSKLIDAGTYKFTVDLSLKDKFEKNFLCPADPEIQTFVIDQRDVNVVWNEMNFDYLGQEGAQSLNGIVSFTDAMGEGVVYAPKYSLYIVDGTDRVELTSHNFVNANTYTLDVEINDNNYNLQSHATKNYTIKPLQITIAANPVDGVTFGDIKVNENLSSYNGYVPSGNADAVSIFNSEASSYTITYSVRSNLSAISNYVTAATHEDAILIHYSGSGNFEVNAVPGDLTVSKRAVHIDVLDQEYYYTGGIINPSSDPTYYVVDVAESLGLNLGVNIIHGTSGVAADHDIVDYGTHNLTCVISNANYAVVYTNSDGESLDGVLEVDTANNYWNPDDEFGINGWVFESGPGVDGIDFPSSIFGTVTATIFDSAGHDVCTFTASDVGSVAFDTMNAGEYTIEFYVAAPDSHNYSGLTGSSAKTHPFTIDQKPLEAWWADDDGEDRFVYEPDVFRTVQLYGYDSKIMSLGDLDSNHPHAEIDGKITMTETEGGTYGVVLTITDENDNYCWKDTSGDVLRVVWEISSIGENFWIVDPSISTEWQYGEEVDYTAGVAVHGGSASVMFYYSSGAEYGQTVPTEIGQYYMLASVAETGSYDGIEKRIDFTITKKTFVKPDVEAKTFAYNGGETVIFDVESYDWFTPLEGYVSYSGNTGAEPGKYSLVLYLDNAHSTSWDDGSTDPLIIEWTISSAGEIIESMFEVDESPVIFSGHPIVKSVNATNLIEGTDYVVSYSNNISSGTAKVIITGIGAYSGQLEYEFSIEQATGQPEFYNEQLKMYVEDSSFYNALQLPSYIDESLLTYTSSDPSIATVDPHTGAITMNTTGSVTITASYPGTANYSAGSATYELTVSDTPVEVVDHVVYIRVPVTDPNDPDDPTDDKPDEPAIVYKNDNTLYIILLLVLAAVCVCFAAYIMYTHRKQENQGGGQR